MSALAKCAVRQLVAKEERFEAKPGAWKSRESQPGDVLIHILISPERRYGRRHWRTSRTHQPQGLVFAAADGRFAEAGRYNAPI
jgi:hypothetical protein